MKNPVYKHLVGVDEVGRGPLAGPVAVGAVLIYAEHYCRVVRLFPVIKDSKKLSAKVREKWFARICDAEEAGFLAISVSFVAPSVIDKKGLSYAIRTALSHALENINPTKHQLGNETSKLVKVMVLLDGGLRAPAHYKNQKTIIKGDEKELVIALASIVAKVTRDARMVKLGKKFPRYGFEKHKGYGTRAHYEAIRKYGITPHHRKSFLRR